MDKIKLHALHGKGDFLSVQNISKLTIKKHEHDNKTIAIYDCFKLVHNVCNLSTLTSMPHTNLFLILKKYHAIYRM